MNTAPKNYYNAESKFCDIFIRAIYYSIKKHYNSNQITAQSFYIEISNKAIKVTPKIGSYLLQYKNESKEILDNRYDIKLHKLNGDYLNISIFYYEELFEILEQLHVCTPYYIMYNGEISYIDKETFNFSELLFLHENKVEICEGISDETQLSLEESFTIVHNKTKMQKNTGMP